MQWGRQGGLQRIPGAPRADRCLPSVILILTPGMETAASLPSPSKALLTREPPRGRALGLPGTRACDGNPYSPSSERQAQHGSWGASASETGQGCGSMFLAWECWGTPSWAVQVALLESPALSPRLSGPGEWAGGSSTQQWAPQRELPLPLRGTPSPSSGQDPPGPHGPI